jgi:PAS domain-containing protein
LINKQFCDLFEISNDAIIGKTDYDFLPEDVADTYRNSDIEVVKIREKEETIHQKIANIRT